MLTTLAFFVLAQGAQNTQEAPDSGVGIGLIIGAVVLVALIAAGIFFVFTKSTRASRGGVVSGRKRGTSPAGRAGRDR